MHPVPHSGLSRQNKNQRRMAREDRQKGEGGGSVRRFEDMASHHKWNSSLLPELLHAPGLYNLSWISRIVITNRCNEKDTAEQQEEEELKRGKIKKDQDKSCIWRGTQGLFIQELPSPLLVSPGDTGPCLSLWLLWEEQHLPLPPFWQSDELLARLGDGKCLWRCVGKQEVTFGNGGLFVCSASLCERPVPDTGRNRNLVMAQT